MRLQKDEKAQVNNKNSTLENHELILVGLMEIDFIKVGLALIKL